ncbi:putative vesicular transport factor (P115) [Vairimorpha necatrix]|uniref:Vesicular transport factor (P115) n=1 Tax=Vairimorpha necatrix TaxID=6039 RepID=A0AAX4J971_9MICR
MFFFRSDSVNNSEDLNIDLLISRLEHSEYLDDKYDALKDLEDYSHRNILETGTHALYPIIYSMEDLEDISYNFRILYSIFTSKYKDEFVDLLLKTNKLVLILMNNQYKDESGFRRLIIELTNNKEFCKVFVEINGASGYSVNLMDMGNTEVIRRLLNLNNNFDKEIVFEGIFEKLLENYKTLPESREILEILLRRNHFNQNYFVETDWTRTRLHSKIINALIDNTNNNINYIKDTVYKTVSFDRALVDKNYEYIYKMIDWSTKYRKIFSSIFFKESLQETLDLENEDLGNLEGKVLGDTDLIIILYYFMHKNILKFESSGFVLLIYSEILRDDLSIPKINLSESKYEIIYKSVLSDPCSVANILLLLSLRNYEYTFDHSILDINLGTILYFLILADTNYILEKSSVLKYLISDDTCDPTLKKFCIFLCCIHGIKLNYNEAYLKENAKHLRNLLVNSKIDSCLFTIDEASVLIIDKLNEFINQ